MASRSPNRALILLRVFGRRQETKKRGLFEGSRSVLTPKQFAWSEVVDAGDVCETDWVGAWSEVATKSRNAGTDSAAEADTMSCNAGTDSAPERTSTVKEIREDVSQERTEMQVMQQSDEISVSQYG